MSTKRTIVGSVYVGQGPSALSEKHTIVASFHDFANLPHEQNVITHSPRIQCHGHSWAIRVFPGGYKKLEGVTTTFVSIFLALVGAPCDVPATIALRVGSTTKERAGRILFKPEVNKNSWGFTKFLPRDDVLDPTNGYLENGTLKVYADIQIYTDTPVVWTPRKRLHLIMSEVFESGQEGDVCFTIGNERFLTFKFLVARRAPILADMAEAVPSGSDVPIDGVDQTMFRALLQFIYTDEFPRTVNLEADARTLLEVADRFGCSCLKLLGESEVVKAGINVENAAELLLFADAHCCALLREAAFDYCVTHPFAVRASVGWKQLKESPELLDEVFGASFPTGSSSGSDLDTMKVATLRQKLDEKNLDVDGTREMLIQRLKDAEETNKESGEESDDDH